MLEKVEDLCFSNFARPSVFLQHAFETRQ